MVLDVILLLELNIKKYNHVQHTTMIRHAKHIIFLQFSLAIHTHGVKIHFEKDKNKIPGEKSLLKWKYSKQKPNSVLKVVRWRLPAKIASARGFVYIMLMHVTVIKRKIDATLAGFSLSNNNKLLPYVQFYKKNKKNSWKVWKANKK